MIIGGLELGFTSVMYDGSKLPLEENLKNTKEVVEMARAYGASVEAELGSMGARGGGVSETDYREVIKRGVRKVNYYTYMAKAGGEAVSNKGYTQFHDVLLDAENAMKYNVISAIKIFANI